MVNCITVLASLIFNLAHNPLLIITNNIPDLITCNLLGSLSNTNIYDDMTPISTTISMTIPSQSDMTLYVNYAFGIYCPIADVQSWTCGSKCTNSGGSNNNIVAVYEDAIQKTRGLMSVNTARGDIVIAFRGSYDAMNFIEDAASAVLVDFPLTGSSGVQVSEGFKLAMESQYNTMVTGNLSQQLTANPTISRVIITGHSLGAAMAELTFAKLRDSTQFGSLDLELFKYGSPRVGNTAFADWMNAKTNQVVRAVNKADLFSHIFLYSEGYVHSGNEYWRKVNGDYVLCNQTVYEDPACSNSLGPNYNTNDHLNYLGVAKDCL